jgi:hypothetical protein
VLSSCSVCGLSMNISTLSRLLFSCDSIMTSLFVAHALCKELLLFTSSDMSLVSGVLDCEEAF